MDENYILSLRCSDQKFSVIGSVMRECIRCGELCWVCPALKDDKTMDGVICTHCITKEEKEMGFILKPEVIEEVKQFSKTPDYAM